MDSGTLTGAPAASTERARQGGGREAGSLGQQSKGTVSGLRPEGHRPRAESLMKASARVGDARPWAEGTLPLSPRLAAHSGAGAGIPPAADGEPLGPPGVVCAPRGDVGRQLPTEALGSGEPGAAAPGRRSRCWGAGEPLPSGALASRPPGPHPPLRPRPVPLSPALQIFLVNAPPVPPPGVTKPLPGRLPQLGAVATSL